MIRCEIVTQERTVYSEDVDMVSLPGLEGRMGILPNHTALLTALSFGEVYIKRNGEETYFAVGGGFAEVQPDKVIILADAADRLDEIDIQKAEEARQEAERIMAEGVPDDPEKYRMIEQQLRLAQLQIDTTMKRNVRRRTDGPQFGA